MPYVISHRAFYITRYQSTIYVQRPTSGNGNLVRGQGQRPCTINVCKPILQEQEMRVVSGDAAEVGYDFYLEGHDGWTQANHHGTDCAEVESRDKLIANIHG